MSSYDAKSIQRRKIELVSLERLHFSNFGTENTGHILGNVSHIICSMLGFKDSYWVRQIFGLNHKYLFIREITDQIKSIIYQNKTNEEIKFINTIFDLGGKLCGHFVEEFLLKNDSCPKILISENKLGELKRKFPEIEMETMPGLDNSSDEADNQPITLERILFEPDQWLIDLNIMSISCSNLDKQNLYCTNLETKIQSLLMKKCRSPRKIVYRTLATTIVANYNSLYSCSVKH